MSIANPTVVFVQGSKPKEQNFPWMFFHFHPTQDVLPTNFDLVFFDFLGGRIKRWNNWTPKRAKQPPPNPSSEVALLPQVQKRLPAGELDTGPARSSVLGFYDWMKKQPAGTVISLHVFSHAFRGGPILWNTSEFGDDGSLLNDLEVDLHRDPNDTDFRIRDFFNGNPAHDPAFKNAFAKDAFIKLWGCVYEPLMRELVQDYWRVPRKKNERNEGQRTAYLRTYLNALAGTFPVTMAAALQLPVWAAPLGWGSTPWEHESSYKGKFPPNLKRDRWWRVSPEFRRGKYDRGVEFYEKVLGARVDATDYVAFEDSWFQAMRKQYPPPSDAETQSASRGAPAMLQQRLLDRIAQLQPRLRLPGEEG